MSLKNRINAINKKLRLNPQDEAEEQELGRRLEEARQRVIASYKREGLEIPPCWEKRLEPEKKPIISGHKFDFGKALNAARERLKERCISCLQRGKCRTSEKYI
jgi:hypothetical protein